jgi:hypothetical protein
MKVNLLGAVRRFFLKRKFWSFFLWRSRLDLDWKSRLEKPSGKAVSRMKNARNDNVRTPKVV